MKKSSVIAIVVGLLLIVTSFAFVKFDPNNYWSDLKKIDNGRDVVQEEAKSVPADNIKQIVITTNNDNVTIVPGGSDEIEIKYYSSNRVQFNIETTNDQLQIKQNEKTRNGFLDYMCFFGCYEHNLVEIRVPATLQVDYNVATSNSQIEMRDLTTNDLKLKSDNGRVRMANVKAGEVSVDNSNARTMIERLTATKLTVVTGNGLIGLFDATIDSDVNLNSSNSRIEVKNVQTVNLSAESDNGAVIIDGLKADTATANSSNSRVEFNNLTATSMNFRSDNGSVKGMLSGSADDYDFNLSSDNGRIVLGNTKYDGNYVVDRGRDRNVTAYSSNSQVNIQFERQ